MQNAGNLLGIEFDRNRGFLGAIDDGRNLAGDAYAAGRILVELALAGLAATTSDQPYFPSHEYSSSLQLLAAAGELLCRSLLADVSFDEAAIFVSQTDQLEAES